MRCVSHALQGVRGPGPSGVVAVLATWDDAMWDAYNWFCTDLLLRPPDDTAALSERMAASAMPAWMQEMVVLVATMVDVVDNATLFEQL